MEIQTRVAPAELWLRDEPGEHLCPALPVLGFGFRLAMSNVGWHVTQKSSFWCPIPSPSRRGRCCSTGEPCDISQDTSFRPLFAGLFVAPRKRNFPRSAAQTLGSAAGVNVDSSPRCGVSYHKSIGGRSSSRWRAGRVELTKKYWTLPKSCGSQSSEWEERKKSRAKRGSLCARRRSRKTVTCHGLRVVEPVYHQASLRGRWRSWRRASRQGQPCSCLFFKTHQIGLLLCFCAEPQTSREVDQDPEGGLTRQCNTRPSFLIMCCVWESIYHKTSAAGFFTEPVEPDTGKPCENSLKTHLIVPLFF